MKALYLIDLIKLTVLNWWDEA